MKLTWDANASGAAPMAPAFSGSFYNSFTFRAQPAAGPGGSYPTSLGLPAAAQLQWRRSLPEHAGLLYLAVCGCVVYAN